MLKNNNYKGLKKITSFKIQQFRTVKNTTLQTHLNSQNSRGTILNS